MCLGHESQQSRRHKFPTAREDVNTVAASKTIANSYAILEKKKTKNSFGDGREWDFDIAFYDVATPKTYNGQIVRSRRFRLETHSYKTKNTSHRI